MSSTEGKVALITGGASGMGRLMATRLANRGVKTAIVDVNQELLDEVCQSHDNITAFNCDVADVDAVNSLVKRVEDELGPIDRVCPAAAIMPALRIAEMDASTFSKVMRINYDGVVNVVKAVMPSMVERNTGQIVLFGSIAGAVPMRGFTAYGASKAAINLFGEVLSEELKNTEVQVLTMRPSSVATPLLEQASGDGGLKGLRKKMRSRKKLTQPGEILDRLEIALKKKQRVCYPTGEAKILALSRRLSPSLTWWLVNKMANDS